MKTRPYRKLAGCALWLLVLLFGQLNAQELNARVTVISNRINSQVEKRVFTTLQNQLTNLLNNRKWTEDNFKQNEKIDCNFVLNIGNQLEPNVYSATLIVQAARPVYNSSYNSPIINWQDENVQFRYVEFQPVEINEGRWGTGDALNSNLSAVLAYYAYTIIGFDYSSFRVKGGEAYFKKANAIVNAFPSSRNISGWSQFDGQRNRYWLSENLLNSRYNSFYEIIYNYYRGGLDQFYDDNRKATEDLMAVLNSLSIFSNSTPNTMIQQFFMQSKSDEIIGMLKPAPPDLKQRAIGILEKVDLTNAKKYREELSK